VTNAGARAQRVTQPGRSHSSLAARASSTTGLAHELPARERTSPPNAGLERSPSKARRAGASAAQAQCTALRAAGRLNANTPREPLLPSSPGGGASRFDQQDCAACASPLRRVTNARPRTQREPLSIARMRRGPASRCTHSRVTRCDRAGRSSRRSQIDPSCHRPRAKTETRSNHGGDGFNTGAAVAIIDPPQPTPRIPGPAPGTARYSLPALHLLRPGSRCRR
jgi:hypothetical protein